MILEYFDEWKDLPSLKLRPRSWVIWGGILTSFKTKQKSIWGILSGTFLVLQMVKNLSAMQETQVQFPGREYVWVKGTATHSSILAWRSPWTEEPGGL